MALRAGATALEPDFAQRGLILVDGTTRSRALSGQSFDERSERAVERRDLLRSQRSPYDGFDRAGVDRPHLSAHRPALFGHTDDPPSPVVAGRLALDIAFMLDPIEQPGKVILGEQHRPLQFEG